MPALPAHRQLHAPVRFEWGPTGAAAIAAEADLTVVVDVLSFTSTTTVALEAGATVLPYRWKDASAGELARSRGAVLAAGRSVAATGEPSLSPAGMRSAALAGQLIVLPSPNGATIAHQLGGTGSTCVAACLRNGAAVGAWLAQQLADRPGTTVAVVAAGERWPDGTLRPAIEDLWGAGAVLTALLSAGADLSAEALVAVAGWRSIDGAAGAAGAALRDCASGRELVGLGFAADVDVAAEVDTSRVVPLLRDGVFVDAAATATVRP